MVLLNQGAASIAFAPIISYLRLVASRKAEKPSSSSPSRRLLHCDFRKFHHRANCLEKTVVISPAPTSVSAWSLSQGRIALYLIVGSAKICNSSWGEQAGRAPSSISPSRHALSKSWTAMGDRVLSVDSSGDREGARFGEPSCLLAKSVRRVRSSSTLSSSRKAAALLRKAGSFEMGQGTEDGESGVSL